MPAECTESSAQSLPPEVPREREFVASRGFSRPADKARIDSNRVERIGVRNSRLRRRSGDAWIEPSAEVVRPHELPFLAHIPAPRLRQFTRAVQIQLREPVLRYSRRMALIQSAEKLGIRRFDANLIIAALERREMNTRKPESARPSRSAGWIAWSLAGAVQAGILCTAWWLFI